MSRAGNRERLLRFLDGIRRPDRRLSEIEEGENLVQSGLIDSLALLEIVSFLESEFGVDFSSTGLDPGRLTTIPSILDLIETETG
ncbi:MAG: phosphopantetheine-binding protein [Acidobacteriota bacterium]